MKIGIIGTIHLDRIISRKGEKIESFGGILYNVIPFGILAPEIEVYPVAWIGEDDLQKIQDLLSSYQNINLEGIRVNPSGTSENLLQYRSEEEREEVLLLRVPPIPFEMISPHLDSSLLLINLISGFDITLETLKEVRRVFRGKIYLDIHSLTLGIDQEGRRFPQGVKEWKEWVGVSDLLQANEREVSLLLSRDLKTEEDLDSAGFTLLDHGPSVVSITSGRRGGRVYFRERRVKVFYSFKGKRRRVVDPTGCGDVYGGGFVLSYLEKGDPLEACNFGNRIAGQTTQSFGIEGLKFLKKFAKPIPK